MKQLSWTETAKNDLQQIYNYIAENSVFYADKVVDELFERVQMIETFPEMGRIVPEINCKNTREVFHYSYRVMYHVSEEHIYITQITHMAQDFKP
jgi:addiction module RelE/StbE family toxin